MTAAASFRTTRYARLATLALSACAGAANVRAQGVAAGGKVDGWIVEQRSSIDSGGGRPPTVRTMRATGTANRLRLESSSTVRGSVGDVVTIADIASHSRTDIFTVRRSFTVRTISGPDVMMKVEPVTQSRTVKDLGPGGSVAGLATHHYLVDATITSRISLGTRSCLIERPSTSEQWTSTDSVAVQVLGKQSKLMMAAVGAATHPVQKDGPPGVPLRSITKQRFTRADGTAGEITSTTEVIVLKRVPLDAGLFAAPPGFLQTPPLTAAQTAKTDSMMRAMSEKTFSRMVDSTPRVPGETRHCTTSTPK